MRLFSNIESAEKGEFSALAALETALAVAISIGIFHYTGSLLHIVISVLITPFLLLRTQRSTEAGLRWFDKLFTLAFELEGRLLGRDPGTVADAIRVIFLRTPSMIGISIGVRIAATFWAFVQEPLESIRAIPQNWWRIAFATDFAHPPEIMPGVELHVKLESADPNDYYLFSGAISEFYGQELSVSERSFGTLIIVSLFLPSILYRLSLKSTSVLYLPFIWIIHAPRESENQRKLLIRELVESHLERVKRIYAWFVLFVLTLAPAYLLAFEPSLRNQFPDHLLWNYFAPIHKLSSWHLSRSLSALLTLVMFFLANKALIRADNTDSKITPTTTLLIQSGVKIRGFLSLWTIGCGLFILLSQIDFESLRVEWLPSLKVPANG